MSNHTPGPWAAKHQAGLTWGVWAKDRKKAVAYCGEEDSRLIAAAPEMYEALKRLRTKVGFSLDYAEQHGALDFADMRRALGQVDDLLRKIEGEENAE